MTAKLLWDEGPGEVRTGLIEDGALTEFRLIRPRHPERAFMATREHYTARIISKLPSGRALATLGFGEDVIVQPAPALPEGTLLAVEMVRGPIPEPGRWKRAIVRPREAEPSSEPGWVFSEEPWEGVLRRLQSDVTQIICPDHASAASVKQSLPGRAADILVEPGEIEDADFDGLMESAVTGVFPIANGELSFERTRAMMMIDVDGVSQALSLNEAAAKEIPRLLRLYDIGGPVGIDFVSMNSRADRASVDSLLADACKNLGLHERTAINGFGFCQIIRPRLGPSVPELLCGTAPGRLSTESRAIALLRAARRSVGHGVRQLTSSPAIIDFIRDRPYEVTSLRCSLGADILLVSDSSVSGYGHVHVVQA